MPRGSLWIGDLGYFALTWLTQLVKQGVYFLMGYKEPVIMWNAQGEQVDVLDLLPTDGSAAQNGTKPQRSGANSRTVPPSLSTSRTAATHCEGAML